MAIDTAAKRLTMIDYGDIFQPGIPVPDGSVTVADRSQFLWSYYLTSAIVYSGLSIFGMDARRRIEALDVPQREGAYLPSLITLPDGSGYWLFGDGSRIMWGSGNTGTGGKAKRRLETLKVKRNG